MDEKRMLRVAGKAVIEADGKILILHPSNIDSHRKWHIPGGVRDDINEPIQQTAIREVHEETGMDISSVNGRVFKVAEWTAVDQGEKVKILAVFFHIKLPSRPEIKLSHEHDDFAWVDASDYKEYESNPDTYEIVEELLG